MSDMLVRLYSLPEIHSCLVKLNAKKITVRRAHPTEKDTIVPWVQFNFNHQWALECQASLIHRPTTCFLATEKVPVRGLSKDPYELPPERLIGFACYDIVALGMFGPEGVLPQYRGHGIGTALLLACLHAMRNTGYGYAIISWAGPTEFYQKVVGATLIPDSEPGVFRGPLTTE